MADSSTVSCAKIFLAGSDAHGYGAHAPASHREGARASGNTESGIARGKRKDFGFPAENGLGRGSARFQAHQPVQVIVALVQRIPHQGGKPQAGFEGRAGTRSFQIYPALQPAHAARIGTAGNHAFNSRVPARLEFFGSRSCQCRPFVKIEILHAHCLP